MDSDDEDEMKAMRTNARHAVPGRSAAKSASAETPNEASDDERDVRIRASASQRAPQRFGSKPPATGDEESSEPEPDLTGVQDSFGFMSFGKKIKIQQANAKDHAGNQRQKKEASRRGVALGSSSGSRSKEVSKGASKGKVASTEEAPPARPDSNKPVGPLPPDEDEVEPEAPPMPGTEKDVLPVSHEVTIPGHTKSVHCISFDPAGSRMATGGLDGQVRLYDFNGMSEAKQAFRNFEPVNGYMVQAVSWSTTGGMFLVCCSDSFLRIFDRDGSSTPVQTTVKGDMYVRTSEHTKGHTQTVTDGMWHPLLNERWISSSIDGTIRMWDINAAPVGMDQVLPNIHVLKCLDKRGVCTGGLGGQGGNGCYPTCCTISADAKRIFGGCSDGSLQLFNDKARFLKPDKMLRTAHSAALTGVCFLGGGDSHLLATRSMDDTMKVWDCRVLSDAKGPLKTFEDLTCKQEKTGLAASADGRYLVTGTSFRGGATQGNGVVKVFDTKDFKVVKTLDIGKRSALAVQWPEALNQVVVGTTSGDVVMLYSPFSSKKGALHFVGKRAKAKKEEADHVMGPIFNMTDPDEIRKFYTTGHGYMPQIRKVEARENQKTLVPARPNQMDGSGGSSTKMTEWVHHIVSKNIQKVPEDKEDIQKTLLAHSEKADKNPQFVGQAYVGNKTIIDWDTQISEEDRRMQDRLKGEFCRKCGLKICRCHDYSDWSKKGNPGSKDVLNRGAPRSDPFGTKRAKLS